MGHCDLDLVSGIILPGAYLIYDFRDDSQIWCMDASLDADMSRTIFKVTVILTFDLVSISIVSGAYLLCYLM